jgi:hypothetical protein
MAKEKIKGLTDEELSAKYPGSFPFPEMPNDASKELKQEILRVRSSSYRKANAECANFVAGLVKQLAEEPEVTISELTPYLKEASDFIAAKRPRSGRPAGVKKERKPLETVVAEFFKNTDNHIDTSGNPTKNSVNGVAVYVGLQMDPVRVKGALKRHNESAEPADRIWVRYDSEARVYLIEGQGADAPEGWTGPVPAPSSPAEV